MEYFETYMMENLMHVSLMHFYFIFLTGFCLKYRMNDSKMTEEKIYRMLLENII